MIDSVVHTGEGLGSLPPAPQPSVPTEGQDAEVLALRSALKALTDACLKADAHEELSEWVDGSLLDAANAALDLQYPVIWTRTQVALLESRQNNSMLHPYTCGGNRSDALHKAQAEEDGDHDTGILIPTVRGWVCPACDYRQFWSHETGGPKAPPSADTPTARPEESK